MSDIDESRAPLIDHLIELRKRLLWCVLALAVTFAASMAVADEIFAILVRPLSEAFADGQGRLVYTKLYEAFFVEVKVALFSAIFFSFPVIATQLWRFVAPGLYVNEKRAFLPFLLATPVLFGAGASLAYFVVMPVAFHWFLGFQGETGGLMLEALPSTDEYLSLVMHFILAFGISFQLPVLILLLHRAGIVTLAQLVKLRRYMIVLAFVIAAIATPPDVISQLMLAIPLIGLFEVSLVLVRLSERRSARRNDSERARTESAAP